MAQHSSNHHLGMIQSRMNFDDAVGEDGGSNDAYLSAFEDDADGVKVDADDESYGAVYIRMG